MGFFSKKTPFPVTVTVLAKDVQDATKAAEALAKVASKFNADEIQKLAKNLDNPGVVAKLKASLLLS